MRVMLYREKRRKISECVKLNKLKTTIEWVTEFKIKKKKRVSNANNQRPSESFSSSNAVNGQLERIEIPVFGGNKLEFPRWQAAFSSCVDSSSLSAQFKMLRLEGCLTGEAAETVKGLGYSEAAYETEKARPLRKYGGSRRQVQGN